jgi:integrase
MQEVLETIPELKIRKWLDNDVKMLFKITYWCALRPTEAIKVKKEDFNLSRRELYLGKTKTVKRGDSTIIPLEFIPELSVYLQGKEEGRLFPGLTYGTMYWWMKRLGKMLKIPAWITPQDKTGEKTLGHIFRKSVGKDMYNGDLGDELKGDVITVSNLMRHSDVGMTMNHYLKLHKEAVKKKW